MAAARNLTLINVQTKQEFKLVKQNGVYKINGDVVVGDLYRDASNPEFAIIDVSNKLHPEDIDALVQHSLTATQQPVTTSNQPPAQSTQH